LTQGEALGLQIEILIKECSVSGSIPTWVTIIVASLLILDDGCHSDLLVSSFAFGSLVIPEIHNSMIFMANEECP